MAPPTPNRSPPDADSDASTITSQWLHTAFERIAQALEAQEGSLSLHVELEAAWNGILSCAIDVSLEDPAGESLQQSPLARNNLLSLVMRVADRVAETDRLRQENMIAKRELRRLSEQTNLAEIMEAYRREEETLSLDGLRRMNGLLRSLAALWKGIRERESKIAAMDLLGFEEEITKVHGEAMKVHQEETMVVAGIMSLIGRVPK